MASAIRCMPLGIITPDAQDCPSVISTEKIVCINLMAPMFASSFPRLKKRLSQDTSPVCSPRHCTRVARARALSMPLEVCPTRELVKPRALRNHLTASTSPVQRFDFSKFRVLFQGQSCWGAGATRPAGHGTKVETAPQVQGSLMWSWIDDRASKGDKNQDGVEDVIMILLYLHLTVRLHDMSCHEQWP